MMNDAEIKKRALGLLWTLGYVVRPELILSQQRVVAGSRNTSRYLALTDIDVVGYGFNPFLKMQCVAIDCGSGKSRSPIERVFWMRGLNEAAGISQSICVVGRSTEEEHRAVAEQLDIALITVSDFPDLVDSLVGKDGAYDLSGYYNSIGQWFDYLSKQPSSLADYLLRENWSREWGRLPIVLPSHLRRWQVKLKFDNAAHRFGFMEAAILLSLGLVRIASQITLSRPADLHSAVMGIVLGGHQRLRTVELLLKRIDDLEKKVTNQPGLLDTSNGQDGFVPYFNELLDVVKRLSSKSGAAKLVPRYIQAMQMAQITTRVEDFADFLNESPQPVSVKLALDVLNYLRVAGHCPVEFMDQFNNI
jgi:hypothetical protein